METTGLSDELLKLFDGLYERLGPWIWAYVGFVGLMFIFVMVFFVIVARRVFSIHREVDRSFGRRWRP